MESILYFKGKSQVYNIWLSLVGKMQEKLNRKRRKAILMGNFSRESTLYFNKSQVYNIWLISVEIIAGEARLKWGKRDNHGLISTGNSTFTIFGLSQWEKF